MGVLGPHRNGIQKVNTVVMGGARLHSGNGTVLVVTKAPAWPNEGDTLILERGLWLPSTRQVRVCSSFWLCGEYSDTIAALIDAYTLHLTALEELHALHAAIRLWVEFDARIQGLEEEGVRSFTE